ncbi:MULTISPECIES: general stress protein [Exiguobacterium]|uniref:General stress protein n=1 Tax=Exiguobacterium antarcticum TaxID=132920 RepID=A0ABT6R6Z0_9BACL|nr:MULTISPECIES: general stress protein [Exiguobacterium]MCT4779809.1 general stress protein [Exiguobacterium soli]MDI3236066.1 general stress protein [Exiguobacterium antarcticum]
MAKKFIGIFHDESSLHQKMQALREQGHKDSDFSVVGRDGAADEASGASWIDQVKSKFSHEPPLRETLKRVGHSDHEAEQHYQEVERGGIALFAKDRHDDHDHDHSRDHLHDEGHRHDGKVENPGVNDYESEHESDHDKSDRSKWKADDLD